MGRRGSVALVVVALACVGLATACPGGLGGEDGSVEGATDVAVTVSSLQPVVTGNLIIRIPEEGMRSSAPPRGAMLGLKLLSSDEDGPARPLARLVVDTRVVGTSLVPVEPSGTSFRPAADDPAATALAPWYEAQRWTCQAAINGFDQETTSWMPIALTCVADAACEQRVPFTVVLLEDVDVPLEVSWAVQASVGYRDYEGEARVDPPPEGATVTVDVGDVRSSDGEDGVDLPIQMIDPGPSGVVPLLIDYPVEAKGGVVRFTVGPTEAWRRSDPWIDGWPERNIYPGGGRDVYEIPLVEGDCDAVRCRMVGTMGDRRTHADGPFRVVVDVRAGAEIDTPPVDGVEVTIG